MLIGSVTPLKPPEIVPVGAPKDGPAKIRTGNLGSAAPCHPRDRRQTGVWERFRRQRRSLTAVEWIPLGGAE